MTTSSKVEARKQFLRHPIEGSFSGILSHFGHHVHAVTFRGFQLKLVLALFAYTALEEMARVVGRQWAIEEGFAQNKKRSR